MDSQQLLWGSKRLIQATQKMLAEFLQEKLKAGVECKEPEPIQAASAFEVCCGGVLRLNYSRKTYALPFGCAQADQIKNLQELLKKSSTAEAPLDEQIFMSELLQKFYSLLEPEFKANQIALDKNQTQFVTPKFLGSWKKISVDKSLRFPFVVGGTPLSFEIPVFDSVQHDKLVQNLYGFSEDARILVVDDSATTRKLSKYILNSAGFLNVDECDDGQPALTKLASSRPPIELVVSDWHMPKMTGLDFLKKIRATPELKDLPFIMVTGEKNAEEVKNAIREGVSGYVVKPFDADAIAKAMKVAAELVKKAKKAAA